MKDKPVVGLFCGGCSGEHFVSVQSAKNVYNSLLEAEFNSKVVYVSQDGTWFLIDTPRDFFEASTYKDIQLPEGTERLTLIPGKKSKSICRENGEPLEIEVCFPIIHGPMGEDGTLQGLFEILDIPYVGPGVLSSALCMDKAAFKEIMVFNQIPTSPYTIVKKQRFSKQKVEELVKSLEFPLFVKPARMGSSVGISKVDVLKDLEQACLEAFKHDTKLVIEQGVSGRELECAVLGEDEPKVSIPGEIVAENKFYSYDAKYLSDDAAKLIIPAKVSDSELVKVKDIVKKAYTACECRGLSRVDFFLTESSEVVINEINTLPGFTAISMFPKLWKESGISYPELVTELVKSAT